jgi:hypothetical protein
VEQIPSRQRSLPRRSSALLQTRRQAPSTQISDSRQSLLSRQVPPAAGQDTAIAARRRIGPARMRALLDGQQIQDEDAWW